MRKYRLISKKGEGTFSEVLKAQSIRTGKYVAVKAMKQVFKSIEQVNNLREIQALRRLMPHPNIIKLEEVLYDRPSGRLALVFELMSMNLFDLIRGRDHYLDPTLVRIYLYQALTSVAYLHSKGIFHRDIKPENILIESSYDIWTGLKLADFGSCRGIYSKPPYTEYISTRWYRAPECLLTDGYYGSEMDVWGLGCVFYEISALVPLFPGENEKDQVRRIHNILGTPDDETLAFFKQHASRHIDMSFSKAKGKGLVSVIPPHVPMEMVDLLSKMLAYHPRKRISAADALKHPYFADLRAQKVPQELRPYYPFSAEASAASSSSSASSSSGAHGRRSGDGGGTESKDGEEEPATTTSSRHAAAAAAATSSSSSKTSSSSHHAAAAASGRGADATGPHGAAAAAGGSDSAAAAAGSSSSGGGDAASSKWRLQRDAEAAAGRPVRPARGPSPTDMAPGEEDLSPSGSTGPRSSPPADFPPARAGGGAAHPNYGGSMGVGVVAGASEVEEEDTAASPGGTHATASASASASGMAVLAGPGSSTAGKHGYGSSSSSLSSTSQQPTLPGMVRLDDASRAAAAAAAVSSDGGGSGRRQPGASLRPRRVQQLGASGGIGAGGSGSTGITGSFGGASGGGGATGSALVGVAGTHLGAARARAAGGVVAVPSASVLASGSATSSPYAMPPYPGSTAVGSGALYTGSSASQGVTRTGASTLSTTSAYGPGGGGGGVTALSSSSLAAAAAVGARRTYPPPAAAAVSSSTVAGGFVAPGLPRGGNGGASALAVASGGVYVGVAGTRPPGGAGGGGPAGGSSALFGSSVPTAAAATGSSSSSAAAHGPGSGVASRLAYSGATGPVIRSGRRTGLPGVSTGASMASGVSGGGGGLYGGGGTSAAFGGASRVVRAPGAVRRR